MNAALIAELTREAATTRRVLERVPEDRLSWRPHPKSMSAGQLALHVAQVPGALAAFLTELVRDPPWVPLPEATTLDEILSEHDASIAAAKAKLSEWNEADLNAEWKMVRNGETLIAVPRLEMIRSIMLNHSYHHRGQLVVYLRLLGVPVPPVYGPTADEQLFD